MSTRKQDVTAQHNGAAMPPAPLFPATHSYSFEQAKSRWQKSWESVLKQCHDVFIRD